MVRPAVKQAGENETKHNNEVDQFQVGLHRGNASTIPVMTPLRTRGGTGQIIAWDNWEIRVQEVSIVRARSCAA